MDGLARGVDAVPKAVLVGSGLALIQAARGRSLVPAGGELLFDRVLVQPRADPLALSNRWIPWAV